jgi:hypothetical protein
MRPADTTWSALIRVRRRQGDGEVAEGAPDTSGTAVRFPSSLRTEEEHRPCATCPEMRRIFYVPLPLRQPKTTLAPDLRIAADDLRRILGVDEFVQGGANSGLNVQLLFAEHIEDRPVVKNIVIALLFHEPQRLMHGLKS